MVITQPSPKQRSLTKQALDSNPIISLYTKRVQRVQPFSHIKNRQKTSRANQYQKKSESMSSRATYRGGRKKNPPHCSYHSTQKKTHHKTTTDPQFKRTASVTHVVSSPAAEIENSTNTKLYFRRVFIPPKNSKIPPRSPPLSPQKLSNSYSLIIDLS